MARPPTPVELKRFGLLAHDIVEMRADGRIVAPFKSGYRVDSNPEVFSAVQISGMAAEARAKRQAAAATRKPDSPRRPMARHEIERPNSPSAAGHRRGESEPRITQAAGAALADDSSSKGGSDEVGERAPAGKGASSNQGRSEPPAVTSAHIAPPSQHVGCDYKMVGASHHDRRPSREINPGAGATGTAKPVGQVAPTEIQTSCGGVESRHALGRSVGENHSTQRARPKVENREVPSGTTGSANGDGCRAEAGVAPGPQDLSTDQREALAAAEGWNTSDAARLRAQMPSSDRDSAYEFAGTKTEITKQIGNAIPVRTARALVAAALWDMEA